MNTEVFFAPGVDDGLVTETFTLRLFVFYTFVVCTLSTIYKVVVLFCFVFASDRLHFVLECRPPSFCLFSFTFPEGRGPK